MAVMNNSLNDIDILAIIRKFLSDRAFTVTELQDVLICLEKELARKKKDEYDIKIRDAIVNGEHITPQWVECRNKALRESQDNFVKE
jgi:hypothetical protein